MIQNKYFTFSLLFKKIAPTSINMKKGQRQRPLDGREHNIQVVGTSTCIYKLILPPPVAAGNVEDLETLWTGPWDMGLKSSVKSEILLKYV